MSFSSLSVNTKRDPWYSCVPSFSQFTLYGDCYKGRRPSFDNAATAENARGLYEYFIARAEAAGVKVSTGIFQADMIVHIENDGPVTVMCESPIAK